MLSRFPIHVDSGIPRETWIARFQALQDSLSPGGSRRERTYFSFFLIQISVICRNILWPKQKSVSFEHHFPPNGSDPCKIMRGREGGGSNRHYLFFFLDNLHYLICAICIARFTAGLVRRSPADNIQLFLTCVLSCACRGTHSCSFFSCWVCHKIPHPSL